MRTFEPASELSSDQRDRELAAILAAGVLRLRQRQKISSHAAKMSQESSAESAAKPLDVSGETVLSVHTG